LPLPPEFFDFVVKVQELGAESGSVAALFYVGSYILLLDAGLRGDKKRVWR
jgi:hypothetical protein